MRIVIPTIWISLMCRYPIWTSVLNINILYCTKCDDTLANRTPRCPITAFFYTSFLASAPWPSPGRGRRSCACQDPRWPVYPPPLQLAKVSWLFMASKVFDMGDTVFMLVKGDQRRLSFLHVFHHGSIFYSWWLCVLFAPGGTSQWSRTGSYPWAQILTRDWLGGYLEPPSRFPQYLPNE